MSVSLGDVGAAAAGTRPTIEQPRETPPETPLLAEGLAELEESRCRTYYDAEEDKELAKEYYPADLDEVDDDELFGQLNSLLSDTHHTVLSYNKARLKHLYPWIDLQEESRQLRGVYSHLLFDPEDVLRREAAMEVQRERAIREFQTHESVGALESFLEDLEAAYPFNCEHVVPQSWFDKKKQMKTDLHHLFTCEWDCNSFRGNRAYFDFEDEASMQRCGESGAGKFEPLHGKAAVARATLYFLVRYPGEIADAKKELPRDRIETLINWHKSADPDRWERHRNAEIQKVQGNRNPFIDFPALVERIDFTQALT